MLQQAVLFLAVLQGVLLCLVFRLIQERAIWSSREVFNASTNETKYIRHEKAHNGGGGKFPSIGTDNFARTCNWTAKPRRTPASNCSFIVRPSAESNEGISWWMATLAIGHTFSLQTGCRLLADYGPDVNVGVVFQPPPGNREFSYMDWIIPSSLEISTNGTLKDEISACRLDRHCSFVVSDRWTKLQLQMIQSALNQKEPLLPVPQYRWAYAGNVHATKHSEVMDLMERLPGYDLKIGMACSLNRLLTLAPSASSYVSNIFTTLLPALRDDGAYVLGLYIRTGRTDQIAQMEADGKSIPADIERGNNPKHMLGWVSKCAIELEKERILDKSYTSVVWMVVTDSPRVKADVMGAFNGQVITNAANNTILRTPLTRKVLTTTSRGIQTRKNRIPSTQDFAEAAIDWFLLGETDVVISYGGMSFGATGSLRTARPIHGIMGSCRKLEWALDNPVD